MNHDLIFDCLSLDLKTAFPGQTGFPVTNIKYVIF